MRNLPSLIAPTTDADVKTATDTCASSAPADTVSVATAETATPEAVPSTVEGPKPDTDKKLVKDPPATTSSNTASPTPASKENSKKSVKVGS